MIKYVITGASSFVGIELTQFLLSKGNYVYAVVRSHATFLLSHPNLTVIYADMSKYFQLDTLIHIADVFINLAWAGTNHQGRNDADIQSKNVEYSLMALRAAKKMGCDVFVESGSQAEYGSVLSQINEDTPCNPFSEYGKSKLEMKNKAFAVSKEIGIKYMHLRIFSLFGEHDHPWTLIMSCLEKMSRNVSINLSSCEQNWNYLHVEDAVRQIYELCVYALNNKLFKQEVYNIASEDTRKLKTFVLTLKHITNSDSQLNFSVYKPEYTVSLNPDVSKVKKTIHFIANHCFENDIKSIYKKMFGI